MSLHQKSPSNRLYFQPKAKSHLQVYSDFGLTLIFRPNRKSHLESDFDFQTKLTKVILSQTLIFRPN